MANVIRNAAAALMLVSLAGVTGCASTSDIEALQAEVAKANSTANQAAADAAEAKRDAAAARTAAEQARDSAQETNEKLDRMFKKSMYK